MNTPETDPLGIVDRLFPVQAQRTLQAGDICTLDGDPRTYGISEIKGNTAIVHLAAYPSATYRRVRLDDCIAFPAEEAG